MNQDDLEKENTMRVLKDQDPIITTPWRCAIGLHRWTQWRTQRIVNELSVWSGKYKSTVHLSAECIHCGIPRARTKKLGIRLQEKG